MSDTPPAGAPEAPGVAYIPPQDEARLAADGLADGAQRPHPLSFVVGGLSGLSNAILPIIAVMWSMDYSAAALPIALGVGLAVVLLSAGLAYVRWRRLTYRVGETDIRVESGIVSRAARSVPYERIQDVSLEQKLLPRLFGLVEVRFETGAGGGDELKLAFLSEEEGERLRETVRDRKETEAPVGSEVASDSAPQAIAASDVPPIFAMDTRRVLTFGLFEFSLALFAVLIGLAQQFDFLLPFDLWDGDTWRALAGEQGNQIASMGVAGQVVGGLLALVGLIVVGMVSGVVRTATREWDFTLLRTPKGFRRRRGMFTRTDVVMPVHRVQALVIATKAIRRRFGWHSLKFVSLAQDSGSSSHVVAPFATMPEIETIVRETGFAMPGEETRWFAADRRYRIDRAVLRAAFFVGLMVAALFSPLPWLAVLPALAIPLIALREWMRWKTTRFAADARQLYTREFWLSPRRKIATRVKLHSAQIAQGPIARRRGYATLRLGLAGGSLAMPGLPLPTAQALRQSVLESIAATDFSVIDGAFGSAGESGPNPA